MRLTIILVLLLVLAMPVYSVGVGFPGDMENIEYIDAGDDLTYNFFIKGDADEHDIRFFVIPVTEGIIEVEGGDRFERTYNLDPYEQMTVRVDIEGVGDGRVKVEYGFAYVQDSTANGVGFEQVVMNTFYVDVDGSILQDEDEDDEENTSGRSSGGGGGGGGGGAGLYMNDTEDEILEDLTATVRVEDAEAALTDISAQGSSFDEMVVADGTPPQVKMPRTTAAETGKGATNAGGMWVLTALVLFTVAAGASFVLRNNVKEN